MTKIEELKNIMEKLKRSNNPMKEQYLDVYEDMIANERCRLIDLILE